MSKKRESGYPIQGTLNWLELVELNAKLMGEDEDFRELQLKQVSSRATNWGKGIQARVEQKIRRSQAPHLEIK
jgi:hypothetical protein